jgi:hypothetical protein
MVYLQSIYNKKKVGGGISTVYFIVQQLLTLSLFEAVLDDVIFAFTGISYGQGSHSKQTAAAAAAAED